MPREPRRRLAAVRSARVDQGYAELAPDPDSADAWTLQVDGTPQSHVDLADPTRLEFEYIRWLGHVVDLMRPVGEPVNALHLGGGAWTLARYVAAVRPGSRQRVVEIDSALVEFVRTYLPATGPAIRVRVGDARAVLETLTDDSADLIVADVYAGARIPAHLTSVEFVGHAARVLRPGGVYAANVADGAPLTFARGQAATLASFFAHTALVAEAPLLRGRRFGNLLLLGSPSPLPISGLSRRTAADPFPARVLDASDVKDFVAGARPTTDATAVPSPEPPPGVLDR